MMPVVIIQVMIQQVAVRILQLSYPFTWGRCPQTPGIYRFGARMAAWLAERLTPPRAIPAAESALRSHPCVAVPSAQVQSVYPLADSQQNVCSRALSQGINTLVLVPLRWPVLKCPPMAGFQMSTEAGEQAKPIRSSTPIADHLFERHNTTHGNGHLNSRFYCARSWVKSNRTSAACVCFL